MISDFGFPNEFKQEIVLWIFLLKNYIIFRLNFITKLLERVDDSEFFGYDLSVLHVFSVEDLAFGMKC